MVTPSTATVAPTASTHGAAAKPCASVAAQMDAGRGNDQIRAVDGSKDDIYCGPGSDRVKANPGDNISGECEKESEGLARRSANQGTRPSRAAGTFRK